MYEEIYKYLNENSDLTKHAAVLRIKRRCNISREDAEDLYIKWRNNYVHGKKD